MNQDEISNGQTYVDIKLFQIPEEDWIRFQEICRVYGRNKASAFRACLDAYHSARMYGMMLTKIDLLEGELEEIKQIKQKEALRTFGGER